MIAVRCLDNALWNYCVSKQRRLNSDCAVWPGYSLFNGSDYHENVIISDPLPIQIPAPVLPYKMESWWVCMPLFLCKWNILCPQLWKKKVRGHIASVLFICFPFHNSVLHTWVRETCTRYLRKYLSEDFDMWRTNSAVSSSVLWVSSPLQTQWFRRQKQTANKKKKKLSSCFTENCLRNSSDSWVLFSVYEHTVS